MDIIAGIVLASILYISHQGGTGITMDKQPTKFGKISVYIAISLLGVAIIIMLIKSFIIGLLAFFLVAFLGYIIFQSEKGAFD